jgi:hypothetical protein
MRKRLKRRPTRAEIGDCEPRRPWPPRLQPRREYQQIETGGSGDGDPPAHFKKGSGGRPKGSINKLSRIVRDCAILAAEDCKHSGGKGLYGYLLYIATKYPAIYTRSILSKLIPLNLNLNAEMRLQSADEIRAELRARGIPVPDRLFAVPRIPSPALQRRPDPAPAPQPDEEQIEPEPAPEPPREQAVNGLDRNHLPSVRKYGNPWASDPRHRPPLDTRPVGETPLGTQYEFAWPSYSSNFDLCCWHEGRPPRLVVSNDEEPTDADRSNDQKTA